MKNKVLIIWSVSLFATASLVTVIWAISKYGKNALKTGGESLVKATETLKKLFYPVGSYVYQGYSAAHNGVDLPVPVGTPIKAPFDGTVSSVYYNELGGNQLIINSSKYSITVGFAHLSKTLVADGDEFKKDEILALSGNTGKSTGAHVHLTTKKDGVLVNPNTVFSFQA